MLGKIEKKYIEKKIRNWRNNKKKLIKKERKEFLLEREKCRGC